MKIGRQIVRALVIVLLLLIICHCAKKWFLNKYVFLQADKSITEVPIGSFPFYFYEGGLLIDSCDFLLDSGCSSSFVHSDSVHSSFNFYIGENINMTDFHNQRKSYPLYYTPRLRGRGRFSLKNVVYVGKPYKTAKEKATFRYAIGKG